VVRDVLSRLDDPSLRVYLVWQPVLADDDLAAARASARGVTDARVVQFWDEGLALGLALGETLGIPPRPRIGDGRGVAWDVYLVYPPGPVVGAGRAPPAPASWLHQLSHLPEEVAPRLEPAALEQRLRRAEGRP
jgi:hypothetical protein